MLSTNWQTLGSADNQIKTSFISPMTLTTYMSSLVIRDGDGMGWPLILLHIESGITFDEAP